MKPKTHVQLFDCSDDADPDDAPRSGVRHAVSVVPARSDREVSPPRVSWMDLKPPQRAFPTTLWNRIKSAGEKDPVALNTLCRAYRGPLLTEALHLTRDPQRAEDLVQGFLESFVAKDLASSADRSRGTFRSFLRSCLRNYAHNVRAKENAWKEGGRAELVDADDAGLTDGLTAERVYNQRWAQALLDRVLVRLCEEETLAGNGPRFEALRDRLVGNNAAPHRETAASLGEKVGTMKVYLSRLRGRHIAILRAEVADTVDRIEDVDRELYELLSAWDEIT